MTQRGTKLTIKDIARLCNVSTQTVSRVINKRPDVAPATREAVEQMIAQMGYQPSALARSLVQQNSYTLGLIIADLRHVGVSQTLNGITEQCEASNYALLLKELQRFDTEHLLPVIETLIAHQVEGIIFAAPALNDNVQIVQAALPATCPPILFLKSQPHPDYTSLSIDNYGGTRQAIEHMLAAGRREIGLITGPLEWLEARQRQQGWEDALRAAGRPAEHRQWAVGNWTSASGTEAMEQLHIRYPEMDAVFASNDQMALGVLHYAAAHGLRVPEDLAVVGFDDLDEAAYFWPALTTVRQPLRELGVLAVTTLLDAIKRGEPAKQITLPTKLIVRASAPGLR